MVALVPAQEWVSLVCLSESFIVECAVEILDQEAQSLVENEACPPNLRVTIGLSASLFAVGC